MDIPMIRKCFIALWLVIAPAGLFGQQDSAGLVWPSPPDRARIRHIQTISSLESLQSKKGFFSKLLSFFTGDESSPRWLTQPVGIAVSPDGRLVIADPGAQCIHIINTVKKEYDFIAETKFGKFVSPVGVAFSRDGRLFVSDSQTGTIIEFNSDFDARKEIKTSLNHPTGMTIVGDTLYVAHTGDHAIALFDLDGNFLSSMGRRGNGKGEFNYPIALAARDSLYVVDAMNYRIETLDRRGQYGSMFGRQGNIAGRFASPKSIALDSDGNIYVTDALMDNVQIFDAGGRLLQIVGRHGSANGEFLSPGGIAVDRSDRIYVVETLNKRIQVFQYIK
jgi:DNA-binding beta-propeller fold protein YncE